MLILDIGHYFSTVFMFSEFICLFDSSLSPDLETRYYYFPKLQGAKFQL